MFHPQPASTLLLNPNYGAYARHHDGPGRHDGPGLLLGLLVSLRELRSPPLPAGRPDATPEAAESVSLPAHAADRSPRVRSDLGGGMPQPPRRRGARALRRRGEIHVPGRRGDRRGR